MGGRLRVIVEGGRLRGRGAGIVWGVCGGVWGDDRGVVGASPRVDARLGEMKRDLDCFWQERWMLWVMVNDEGWFERRLAQQGQWAFVRALSRPLREGGREVGSRSKVLSCHGYMGISGSRYSLGM